MAPPFLGCRARGGLGIGLSVASLIVMPLLGPAEKRIGERLDSRATIGEGGQNILCAYLAIAVLAGLLANAWPGLWWLDPVIALGIAALTVHEGREAGEGEKTTTEHRAQSPAPDSRLPRTPPAETPHERRPRPP